MFFIIERNFVNTQIGRMLLCFFIDEYEPTIITNLSSLKIILIKILARDQDSFTTLSW